MVSYDLAHDGSLISRLQDGDTSALAHLYDRYNNVALRLASRVLGSRGGSEDVVQESFLSIWRHAESYNPLSGTVHNWLFAIVRNRALDTLRRTKPVQLAPLDDDIVDRRVSTVFGMVAERMDRERVRDALKSLPRPQRDVIDKVYFKGMTAKEAADQIGVPVGTVKSRLRLALQHLRLELHKEDFSADA